jgi:DNA repair protein SbcC/Rad50
MNLIDVNTKIAKHNKITFKSIYHLADIHIHNDKRHEDYDNIFKKVYTLIEKDNNDKSQSLIYIAGDIFHYSRKLSPDCINLAINLLSKLSELAAVLVVIAGNHDNNIRNKIDGNIDSITSIITQFNLNNKVIYLKDSGVYNIGTNIAFGLTSVFELDSVSSRKAKLEKLVRAEKITDEERIKIAVCHCGIDRTLSHNQYLLRDQDYKVSDFKGYQLVLLGDNHNTNYIMNSTNCKAADFPKDLDNKIAYPGSLIQQNFGEGYGGHGFLVWDLKTLKSKFIEVKHDYGYQTINIKNNNLIFQSGNSCKSTNVNDSIKKEIDKYASIRINIDDPKFNQNRLLKLKKKISSLVPNNKGIFFNYVYDHSQENVNNNSSTLFSFEEYVKSKEKVNYDAILKLHEEKIKNIKNNDNNNCVWEPKSIEFKGLFCYKKKQTVKLFKLDSTVLLSGPNYSGKSSFVDILIYSIWGSISRADIKKIVSNDFMTTMIINMSDDLYKIERTGKYNKKNDSLSQKVTVYKNDVEISTGSNMTSSSPNKFIVDNFGSLTTTLSTNILTQSNGNKFINSKASERKNVLVNLFDLGVYDQLHDDVKNDIKKLDSEIVVIDKMNEKFSDSIDFNTTELQKLETKDNIDSKIATSTKELHDINKVNDNLHQLIGSGTTEIAKISDNISEKNTQLSETLCTINQLKKEINMFNSSNNDLENFNPSNKSNVENKHEEWLKDNNSKINDIRDKVDKLRDQRYPLQHTRDMNKEIRKLTDRIGELDTKCERLNGKIKKNIVNPNINLEEVTDKYNKLDRKVINCKAHIKQNKISIKKQDQIIKKTHGLKYDTNCKCCNNNEKVFPVNAPKEEKKRLEKELKELEEKFNKDEEILFDLGDEIDDQTDYNEAKRENDALTERIKLLKEKVDLKNAEIKQLEDHNSKIKKNQEIDDNINQHKAEIKNIIEMKDSQYETYIDLFNKWEEHKEKAELIESKKREREELKNNIQRFTRESVTLDEKLNEAKLEITDLNNKLNNGRDKIDKISTDINKLKDSLSNINIIERSLKESTKYLSENKFKAIKFKKEKSICVKYKNYTHRDNYQLYLISNIIPKIQDEINNILSSVFKFTLEFNLDKNNINIYKVNTTSAGNPGTKHLIDTGSGSELFVCSLAMRIALSKLSSTSNGNFMIIDEGFGSLDSTHLSKIGDLFQVVKNIFKFMLIITHVDSIKSVVDSIINITRTSSGSIINQK